METNQKRVVLPGKGKENIPQNTWVRIFPENLFFAAGFSLSGKSDLTPLTRTLPDGVVICDSRVIGGIEHLEQVLFQATEYWLRGGEIARKKSIDLLMRITCQRQINDAIDISKINATDSFAIFGIVKSTAEIEEILQLVTARYPSAKRKDSLLAVDRAKLNFLRKLHRLPKSATKDQIIVAIKEKSALLVFSN